MSYGPDKLYDLNAPASDVHNHSQPPPATPYTAYDSPSSYSPKSATPVVLPKVGEHRCYWALLSSELCFVYLDPVLQSHLEDQASALLGQSLLSFIHPDEQASAKADIGESLDSKVPSITRASFCRLSCVRRMLGHDGPTAHVPSAQKFTLDENYMAVNIVLNYAAEGLVLCFLHAAADIDPVADNDISCISPCWPLDLASPSVYDLASHISTIDFTKVDSQASSNCTKRFRSEGELQGVDVESVYITHGSVIFACHKLKPSSVHNASTLTTASIPDATVAAMGYNAPSASSYSLPPPHPQQPSYYDQQHYPLPPLSSSAISPYSYVPPPQQHSNSVSSHYPAYPNSWSSQPATHPSVQILRPGYWNHSHSGYENHQGPPALSLSGPHDNYRPLSPGYSTYTSVSSTGTDHLSDSQPSPTSGSPTSADVVPPPRRRVSPAQRESNRLESNVSAGREGRGHGNRPAGILKCSSCKATTSPEWRKGPSGKKELCNACGLRYARSRAKKEGHVPSSGSRRRKDKILKRDTSPPASTPSPASSGAPSSYPSSSSLSYQNPSTSPYTSGSSVRRSYASSYEDSSFSSTGSTGSSSDIYVPHRSNGTASPSPPAGTTLFSYGSGSDGHGHRAGYYGSSIPSPLASNVPTTLPSQSYERESHRDGGNRDSQAPLSSESKRYYEATSLRESPTKFDRLEKKEDKPYDKEYRGYEQEERGRGLVSH
ncbi:hypothetical protein D9758_003673 [Tetrapyrgos nigripes]|uniref:GATA-type domain-containing protein n=1 Tax=Tetrapyrgos nigripes TaxID=182062 RepID=A0A8H5GLV5_9AGAR|nr:hypothetical protein D9758_003673 [Tetrapyrgos nigripes]